jgi:hypothetical protein
MVSLSLKDAQKVASAIFDSNSTLMLCYSPFNSFCFQTMGYDSIAGHPFHQALHNSHPSYTQPLGHQLGINSMKEPSAIHFESNAARVNSNSASRLATVP